MVFLTDSEKQRRLHAACKYIDGHQNSLFSKNDLRISTKTYYYVPSAYMHKSVNDLPNEVLTLMAYQGHRRRSSRDNQRSQMNASLGSFSSLNLDNLTADDFLSGLEFQPQQPSPMVNQGHTRPPTQPQVVNNQGYVPLPTQNEYIQPMANQGYTQPPLEPVQQPMANQGYTQPPLEHVQQLMANQGYTLPQPPPEPVQQPMANQGYTQQIDANFTYIPAPVQVTYPKTLSELFDFVSASIPGIRMNEGSVVTNLQNELAVAKRRIAELEQEATMFKEIAHIVKKQRT